MDVTVEVVAGVWDRELLETVARRNGIAPSRLVHADPAHFAVLGDTGMVFLRLEMWHPAHPDLTDVRWCTVGWDELSIPARDAIQERMAVLPLD